MMLRGAFAALSMLLVLTTPAWASASTDVERSFEAYKQALIDGDGAKASRLTTADTHAYLKQTLDRALTMKEQDLRALPLVDQISVLMLRHNMKPDQLRAMRDGDPIAYAVDHRAFDTKEVAKLQVAEFTVNGTEAQAPLSNLKGAPMPVDVYFKEEAGTWRFDLLSSIAPFRAIFESQTGFLAKLNGSDGKGALVPLIVHLITGRAPDANIWNPPG